MLTTIFRLNILSVNHSPGINVHSPSIGHIRRRPGVAFPSILLQNPASKRYDPGIQTKFNLGPSSRFLRSSTTIQVQVLAPRSNTTKNPSGKLTKENQLRLAHGNSVWCPLLLPRDPNPFERFRWRPGLVIVKFVRLDSNADYLPRIDVHAFCGLGIEHVVDSWFGFAARGRREPEMRSFVWVADMTYKIIGR